MGTIRVEFTPVQKYNLGLIGIDHIQLVYQDETSFVDRQDHWYVLEGILEEDGFLPTLGVQGEEFYTPLSAANNASGDALIDKIGTPESRGSRPIIVGPQALSLWDAMSNYGTELQLQGYPYTGFSLPYSASPTISSSSAVATMLWSIGIDINLVMPFSIGFSPGTSTLLGTTQVDEITLEGSFTQVVSGLGEDILRGSSATSGIEKFYGGNDNDTIHWSAADNIIHGGEPLLIYALDGLDTIDYSGVGEVTFYNNTHAVEHKTPQFYTAFDGGYDQLFSIEKVSWLQGRDIVNVREGIDILEVPIEFNLDESTDGGEGDQLIFTDSQAPLIINFIDDTMISVQTIENAGQDAGIWAQSVETVVGSAADDLIYAGATVTVVDGGGGDDIIDGRFSVAFSGASPLNYDIELFGNDGNDTIVSGSGSTLAHGGDGSDMFILSAMGTGNGEPEFVILDAESDDQLYVPYNFFKTARGDYEDSELFQITGGPFKIDEFNSVSFFDWGIPDDNTIDGFIEFSGRITFEMDDADLIIKLVQGHTETTSIDYGPGEPPGPPMTAAALEFETETVIRVVDWSEGDLGITFPLTLDFEILFETGVLEDYPGWLGAVHNATGASRFISPLDERPDAYLPPELEQAAVSARISALPDSGATEGNDVILKAVWSSDGIEGLGGDDDITGSAGGDLIVGGAGSDTMAGGRGNDTYYVDSVGDHVVEAYREGFDRVYSSIDYTLGANVEHVTLTGNARSAQGNELRNTIVGNDADNILVGGAGHDTLAGNKGDDELFGGDGSDGYVYESGDGNDIIIDAPGSGDEDVIVLAGNYRPEDVSFFRDPAAMDDLILRFVGGGSLTIRDHFNGSAIDSVEFITETVWNTVDVQDRATAATISANDIPDARPDSYIYAGSGDFTISGAALLENDSDPDGDTLTIVSITDVSQGIVTVDASGNVLVSSLGSATTVNFRYWVSDGHGGTSSALAEIAIFQNQVPQITSAELAPVLEDLESAGRIFATDPDGDSLVYRVKDGAGPLSGTVIFGENGNFIYRPNENYNGADAFTIVVTDALTGTAEFNFNPVIAARNDNPIAQADLLGVLQGGSSKVFTSSALLGNAMDLPGFSGERFSPSGRLS